MRLPIRDRGAAANYADAVVAKRQDILARRSTEQNVRQQVLNAVSQVESSKASVKLAVVAQGFAQKQLDAEQKKYDLGTSVIFFVLDAQTRLVNAEAALVNQSGGRRLIRITDDGHGMLRDDAMLAFERHATSKLSSLKDLQSIATLGFRGEALPSIGSVSRLTMETRAPEETTGTRVEIQGGKMISGVSSTVSVVGLYWISW